MKRLLPLLALLAACAPALEPKGELVRVCNDGRVYDDAGQLRLYPTAQGRLYGEPMPIRSNVSLEQVCP